MDSLVPASKISDLPTGWLCGQTARDFVKTKTGRGGSMDVQKSEEFQTTKFFCKTDMDMKAIQEEEADYANYPIPKFYHFKSRDARERILYANFNQVERDVKNMVAAIFEKQKAKNPQDSVKTVAAGKYKIALSNLIRTVLTPFCIIISFNYKALNENASLNGTCNFVSCLYFSHASSK